MTGRDIATKREKLGLTQAQLAEYLEISRTGLWRLETGSAPLTRSMEIFIETLEIGNKHYDKWIASLPMSQTAAIRRRKQKLKFRETVNAPIHKSGKIPRMGHPSRSF
jgi:transcriptional regulator with XRE-family HTH domain